MLRFFQSFPYFLYGVRPFVFLTLSFVLIVVLFFYVLLLLGVWLFLVAPWLGLARLIVFETFFQNELYGRVLGFELLLVWGLEVLRLGVWLHLQCLNLLIS